MIFRKIPNFLILLLTVIVIFSVINAFAATIDIPPIRFGVETRLITANDLKPPECDSIQLVTKVVCSGGNCNGTASNDLIVGSADNDIIKGKDGDDCIVGGDGDDTISGDKGYDVCIGGNGNDKIETKNEDCNTVYQ